jgi:hypothetical protein
LFENLQRRFRQEVESLIVELLSTMEKKIKSKLKEKRLLTPGNVVCKTRIEFTELAQL